MTHEAWYWPKHFLWVTSHNMHMHAACLFLQWCNFVCVYHNFTLVPRPHPAFCHCCSHPQEWGFVNPLNRYHSHSTQTLDSACMGVRDEMAKQTRNSLQHSWCMRPGIDQSTSCRWLYITRICMLPVFSYSDVVNLCIPQFQSCSQAPPSFLSLAVTHTNEANTFCQSTHSHRSYPDSRFCLHGCNKNTVLGLSDCSRPPRQHFI